MKPDGSGITPKAIEAFAPMLKPQLLNMAKSMIPDAKKKFMEGDLMDPATLKSEIDQMLTDRLNEIKEDQVKTLMEEVIRKHLHWLVIWGNVFGGLLGVISAIAQLL